MRTRRITLSTTFLELPTDPAVQGGDRGQDRPGAQVPQGIERGASRGSADPVVGVRRFTCQLWLRVDPSWRVGKVLEIEGRLWTIEAIGERSARDVSVRWTASVARARRQARRLHAVATVRKTA